MISSITEYVSYFEAGEDMTDEEYGQYMRAVHRFAFLDEEPDYSTFTPLVKAALRTVIASVRRSKKDRENGGKRNTDVPRENYRAVAKTENLDPPFDYPSVNDNGNDKENGNENLNSYAASAPSELETPPSQPKKPPLTDREPVNDLERVEKAYLDHYASLYDKGILKIPKPCVNWGQCRKLERERITEYGLEKILSALDKAAQDNFCVQRGYSLSMILSAGTLNSLFNGNGWKHDQRAIDSVDRVTDAELSDVPF